MERYVPFIKGQFYHLYNRGIDKRNIFFSTGDWQHFQRLLYISNSTSHQKIRISRIKNKPLQEIKRQETLVDICAYTLMENHFHLLVHEKNEGSISTFMRKLLTSFSMYMNRKYERSGALMCRPFRAKHIDSDEYLGRLISYIHLNPLNYFDKNWKEQGIKDTEKALQFLHSYKYSSYHDFFLGKRDESLILAEDVIPIEMEDLKNLDHFASGLGAS